MRLEAIPISVVDDKDVEEDNFLGRRVPPAPAGHRTEAECVAESEQDLGGPPLYGAK